MIIDTVGDFSYLAIFIPLSSHNLSFCISSTTFFRNPIESTIMFPFSNALGRAPPTRAPSTPRDANNRLHHTTNSLLHDAQCGARSSWNRQQLPIQDFTSNQDSTSNQVPFRLPGSRQHPLRIDDISGDRPVVPDVPWDIAAEDDDNVSVQNSTDYRFPCTVRQSKHLTVGGRALVGRIIGPGLERVTHEERATMDESAATHLAIWLIDAGKPVPAWLSAKMRGSGPIPVRQKYRKHSLTPIEQEGVCKKMSQLLDDENPFMKSEESHVLHSFALAHAKAMPSGKPAILASMRSYVETIAPFVMQRALAVTDSSVGHNPDEETMQNQYRLALRKRCTTQGDQLNSAKRRAVENLEHPAQPQAQRQAHAQAQPQAQPRANNAQPQAQPRTNNAQVIEVTPIKIAAAAASVAAATAATCVALFH